MDSSYTVAFSGNLFPIAIDQRRQIITNIEELPLNTHLNAILVTIAAKGTVIYTPTPATGDSEWKAYSSTDSIDFSSPLVFRVYAGDYEDNYRDYTATLTLRQDEARSYSWQQMDTVDALAGRTQAKLLNVGELPIFLSVDTNNRIHATTGRWNGATFTEQPTEWLDQPCTGADGGQVRQTQIYGNRLWMSTEKGGLIVSDDGINWATVEQIENGRLRLLAASSKALYAQRFDDAETTTMVSSPDGIHWMEIALEDEGLFGEDAASIAYTQTNGNCRVLVAARTTEANETTLCVWSLLEDSKEPWTRFSNRPADPFQLPSQTETSIVFYNEWLMAVMPTSILFSYDNGITWKTDSYLSIPNTLASATGATTAATFGEYVWIAKGSQLWRVRYADYVK